MCAPICRNGFHFRLLPLSFFVVWFVSLGFFLCFVCAETSFYSFAI